MRPIRYATKELVRAFDARKVLDLAQVKAALGTPVKMTALRQQQVQAEAVSFMGLGLEADLRPHLQAFLATLNEKQRRLYAGFESLRLGRGGDTIVAGWTGLNVKTVARGRQELHSGGVSIDRVRAVGAGRPALKKTHEPNRGAAHRRHGR